MSSNNFYTQTNNGLTLVSSHRDTYRPIAVILIVMILSTFFVPLFNKNCNEIILIILLLIVSAAGFVIGMKCTYVRCCTINLFTNKIKVKEKFISGWKKMEFNISDTFVHSTYYQQTDGGDTMGTVKCWDVKLSNKFNNKKLLVKQYLNEDETKMAMKQLVNKLYPSLESLSYDEIFEKYGNETYQIKF